MDSKKLGIMIATNMPPPGALKKKMAMDDSGSDDSTESDQEATDEADSGESGGGKMALGSMFSALKSGDTGAAWDAFMDAIKIAKSAGSKDDGGDY